MTRAWPMLLALLSCSIEDPAPTATSEPSPEVRLLTRASLDLRGTRPTLDELDRYASGETSYEEFVDAFLSEEGYAQRVADLYAEVWQTRSEAHFVNAILYYGEYSEEMLARSIGDEPLQMLGYIAANDLPYTELVTADWTMANEITGAMWPVDYPTGATGWRKVKYTDDRPAVGALVSNGLWWHFGSMENNKNRGRANQTSRIFLCDDFLNREIVFGTDQDLTTADALTNALREDPRCAGCHDTLDPLAAHFYGFWWLATSKNMPSENAFYHPERETEWRNLGELPPSYFGTPTSGMADLGRLVAQDNRYNRCMITRTWELLMRQSAVDNMDSVIYGQHEKQFRGHGLSIRALMRSIVTHDNYVDAAEFSVDRLVTPYILSRTVQDMTGYVWQVDGWDLLGAPETGFLILAGGADGDILKSAVSDPTVTMHLVQQRLAEGAADYAVDSDLADLGSATLLTAIDGTETAVTGLDRIAAQIALLRRRALSHNTAATDDIDTTELVTLWQAVYDSDVTLTHEERGMVAWKAVITAILRDPDMLIY